VNEWSRMECMSEVELSEVFNGQELRMKHGSENVNE